MKPELCSSDQITKITFSTYDQERVEKLGIKRIINSSSFDQLGLPVTGGLYDPCMGSTFTNDTCTTCNLTNRYCPGHFGYIQLALPVFNPVFYRFLISLLKRCCVWCNRFQMKIAKKALFVQKIRLISHDFLTEAMNLDEKYESWSYKSEGNKTKDESADELLCVRIRKFATKIIENGGKTNLKSHKITRNTQEAKSAILKSFLTTSQGDISLKFCDQCHLPKVNIKSDSSGLPCFSAINQKAFEKYRVMFDEIKDKCIVKIDENLTKKTQYLTPLEVQSYLENLVINEKELLSAIFGCVTEASESSSIGISDKFFLKKILVMPNRFRPALEVGESTFDNPFTIMYGKIITSSHLLQDTILSEKNNSDIQTPRKSMAKNTRRKSMMGESNNSLSEQLQMDWMNLQVNINGLFDTNVSTKGKEKLYGIRQSLEKKEGLFRMHMMGKRVNFAGRSVISPDPNLNVHEVGIPMVIAKGLSYPEPVNSFNLTKLRDAVIRGPENYPGSVAVVKNTGNTGINSSFDKVILSVTNQNQRESCAKQLLIPQVAELEGESCNKDASDKIVLRHPLNDDHMLINRQPSLHRPSIMSHSVRVLPKESSLRLHYANCKAYNADFDGDEMNAHLPQNYMGQAEARYLMSTVHHFLSPRDARPLTGLVQDYVVSGVLLTLRDCFLTRDQYMQLVFKGLIDHPKAIKILPPAIMKPSVLWTGKQVVSTLIQNITPQNLPCLNMEGKSKIVDKFWKKSTSQKTETYQGDLTDDNVIVRNGEWISGILDKNQFGASAYSLIHVVFELYGGMVSSILLSVLGRTTIAFLQYHGFTLGIEDVVCQMRAVKKREELIEKSRSMGAQVQRSYFNVLNASDEELKNMYRSLHVNYTWNPQKNTRDYLRLEMHLKHSSNEYTNQINRTCLPDGLLKKFPYNSLQLMIQAGAKGSSVNAMQISCLLGQIELEGRRPPLMCSGKSLPAYLPYDLSFNSGGFVVGSFLYSIKPTEYFFHCMAGREGLVDTAVKTSRSGYLQRCIVKHLEGLQVSYDHSVRDSDGSIIQFLYGDDGCDPTKIQFAYDKKFDIFYQNPGPLEFSLNFDAASKLLDLSTAKKLRRRLNKNYCDINSNKRISPLNFLIPLCEGEKSLKKKLKKKWYDLSDDQRQSLMISCNMIKKEPILGNLAPSHYFGAVSDIYDRNLNDFTKSSKCAGNLSSCSGCSFEELMLLKYIHALSSPGESVGVLAAQSIGEPSTQMTLNTFHFAGRGEVNLTLGIPRLREIFMIASPNINTPIITIPVKNDTHSHNLSKKLEKSLKFIALSHFMDNIQVTQEIISDKSSKHFYRKYTLNIYLNVNFCREAGERFQVNQIIKYLQSTFFKKFFSYVSKKTTSWRTSRIVEGNQASVEPSGAANEESSENEDNRDNDKNEDDESESEQESDLDLDEALSDSEKVSNVDDRGEKSGKRHIPDQESDVSEEESSFLDEELSANEHDSNLVPSRKKQAKLPKKAEVSSVFLNENRNKSKEDESQTEKISDEASDFRLPSYVSKYERDPQDESHIIIEFSTLASMPTLKITSVFSKLAEKCIVNLIPKTTNVGVGNVSPSSDWADRDKQMNIEGDNIQYFLKFSEFLELDRLRSNNIHQMAQVYGIEAARATLIKEINQVFSDYGIVVNFRHLSLVSDYMTYSGTYLPLNRHGISPCSSPIQKMTFETTMNFLKNACLSNQTDNIDSPSARLVVGRPVSVGTGSFQVVMKNQENRWR